MIPQSFIQELLARVDIVDVVGKAVKLKKAGANLQGLCPFHNEKTPSFSVSPTKQFYHCFGCGAHGTAIGFMMDHYGLGFVDAVRELAQEVGLEVPRDNSPEAAQAAEKAKQHDTLGDWLERAASYYRQRLKHTPAAIEYLKDRGLTGETARDFGLGYAPGEWRNLDGVLPDYGAKEAVESGLVKASDDGKRYDYFRDRVMFPIRNPRGKVIGFGGRVMGKGEPKYLNSPEGPLFSKGRELYGLFESREGIRAAGKVLVVEGYMDVVMLHQHGCRYAVATLGTATTAVHLQKLFRLADQIVFSFDGDAAGKRAAWRALENALPLLSDTKQLEFLFLPPEHDPDSFVREEGLEAFEAQVNAALPLSSFLLKELASRADITTPEGRARMQAELKPLVLQMPEIALRTQILMDMAARLGVPHEELFAYCGIRLAQQPARSAQSRQGGWPSGGQARGHSGAYSGARAGAQFGGRDGASWSGQADAGHNANPYGRPDHAGQDRGAWQPAGAGREGRTPYGRQGEGRGAAGTASGQYAAGRSGQNRFQGQGPGGGTQGMGARRAEGAAGSMRAGQGGSSGRWREDSPGRAGLSGVLARSRPEPPTLQQRVCLLLAYHPVLAREPLEDSRFLSDTLLDWREQLASLPDGAHYATVLTTMRERSPRAADFIETLDERDGGVMANMDIDQARRTYQMALKRLALDEVRHEIVRVVAQGLDKPEVESRYKELTTLMRRLSETGNPVEDAADSGSANAI